MIDPSVQHYPLAKTTSGRAWPWFLSAAILLVLDQVTKAIVRMSMLEHESIPLIGSDFLRLTYVRNPGIAFGMEIFGVKTLIVFNLVAAVILTYYLLKMARRADPLRWPLMLFLVGAIGNNIDRIFFGKVTDFMDADFPDIIMERWPVFNVADSCVTIGITLVLIIILFSQSKPSLSSAPTSEKGDSFTEGSLTAENHARIPSSSNSLSDHDRGGTTSATD